MMAQRIQVTEELLDRLENAQRKRLMECLATGDLGHGPYHRYNDQGDYTASALDLYQVMFNMGWDQLDLDALNALLNTPYEEDPTDDVVVWGEHPSQTVPRLGQLAGEGVAQEFYELDCPALPKEVD